MVHRPFNSNLVLASSSFKAKAAFGFFSFFIFFSWPQNTLFLPWFKKRNKWTCNTANKRKQRVSQAFFFKQLVCTSKVERNGNLWRLQTFFHQREVQLHLFAPLQVRHWEQARLFFPRYFINLVTFHLELKVKFQNTQLNFSCTNYIEYKAMLESINR